MNQDDDAKRTVLDLETQRYAAMVRSDVHTLARMFADELVYSHSDGGRDTKGSLLEKIVSGYLTYFAIDNPDQEVTIIDRTAVVTGRMVAHLNVDGAARRLNNRCLSVWVLRGGDWLFLAYQPTVLPQIRSA